MKFLQFLSVVLIHYMQLKLAYSFNCKLFTSSMPMVSIRNFKCRSEHKTNRPRSHDVLLQFESDKQSLQKFDTEVSTSTTEGYFPIIALCAYLQNLNVYQ